MTSPFRLPEVVPPPLANGHQFSRLPNARFRERDQGERRARPRFRSSPDVVELRWNLTQDQFDALDTFYEETIDSGARTFDLQVNFRGAGVAREWFTALWVGPYSWNVGTGQTTSLTYVVTATVWLLESLGETRVAPGITATGIDTDAGFAISRDGAFSAVGTDTDDGSALMVGPVLVVYDTDIDEGSWFTDFVSSVPRITEAGDTRVTEDDDRRVTE